MSSSKKNPTMSKTTPVNNNFFKRLIAVKKTIRDETRENTLYPFFDDPFGNRWLNLWSDTNSSSAPGLETKGEQTGSTGKRAINNMDSTKATKSHNGFFKRITAVKKAIQNETETKILSPFSDGGFSNAFSNGYTWADALTQAQNPPLKTKEDTEKSTSEETVRNTK